MHMVTKLTILCCLAFALTWYERHGKEIVENITSCRSIPFENSATVVEDVVIQPENTTTVEVCTWHIFYHKYYFGSRATDNNTCSTRFDLSDPRVVLGHSCGRTREELIKHQSENDPCYYALTKSCKFLKTLEEHEDKIMATKLLQCTP